MSAHMTDIDVPDWVVEIYRRTYRENFIDGRLLKVDERINRALTAALGAWVVPMKIEWSHVREEKVYLPGNSLVAASRYAANLPPPEAEYRHIWQAKLIASTKNNELPPQDLCRITLRQEKPE
jgi:hypothetical protein